jgi:hypothetical protein
MILNKKIKYSLYLFTIPSVALIMLNKYKKHYSTFTIDLNGMEFGFFPKSENKKTENLKMIKKEENPFELVENFNLEEYFLNKMMITLYTPPLTNKLFPKSNLYGHELIRYFDQ